MLAGSRHFCNNISLTFFALITKLRSSSKCFQKLTTLYWNNHWPADVLNKGILIAVNFCQTAVFYFIYWKWTRWLKSLESWNLKHVLHNLSDLAYKCMKQWEPRHGNQMSGHRSFSLSRTKKLNWKPSGGRSQENEML